MNNWVSVHNEPPKLVPTQHMVDGPLIGNGDLGVVMAGPATHLQFWISKSDFWRAAEWIDDTSRFGRTMGAPCCISMLGFRIFRAHHDTYRIEQDIQKAELRGTFRTHEGDDIDLKAWVSANENLLVVEITSSGLAWMDIELETRTSRLVSSECNYDEDGNIELRRSYLEGVDWPTEAGVCMRRIDTGDNPKWRHKLLEGQKTAVYVLAVCTNHDSGDDFMDIARKRIAEITLDEVEKLRKEHQEWWSDFWSKSDIEVGDDLLELGWHGSNYIMACCSRNHHFPPGLFGNWLTTDEPYWAGDYHLNYNYQAPWWGVFSSNHVELSDPYDAPIMAFIPRARKFAKDLLNCRGVYYPIGLGPKGNATATIFHGQKCNAAFVAANMMMRFRATWDMDYARNIAYPFIVECANFWEDYLNFNEGRYVIDRDAIQEDYEDTKDVNPIMSLGLVYAVFRGALQLSEELGVDEDRREKWQHIYDHLSKFPTMERNGQTVFRLTEQGRDWNPNNSVVLQHIIPACCIGLGSDPELLQIALNTVTQKARWKDDNAFPVMYPTAARVGFDPVELLRQLHLRLEEDMRPNLLVYQWGGGIETCGGTTMCLNEMLMQSFEGVIRFFPNWPKDRPAKFTSLRADGAFLVSAEYKDGKVISAELTSEKGRPCTVQNPWPGRKLVVKQDGRDIPLEVKGDHYTFTTEPDGKYTLSY